MLRCPWSGSPWRWPATQPVLLVRPKLCALGLPPSLLVDSQILSWAEGRLGAIPRRCRSCSFGVSAPHCEQGLGLTAPRVRGLSLLCHALWLGDPMAGWLEGCLPGAWCSVGSSLALPPGSTPGCGAGAGGFVVLHAQRQAAPRPPFRLQMMALHHGVPSPLTRVSRWSVPGPGPASCPAQGCGLQDGPSLSARSSPPPWCQATAQHWLLDPLPALGTGPVQNQGASAHRLSLAR